MLEQALIGQSQFVGRDGFRWWIGQIAPLDAQPDQTTKGEGWGNRYKVRIMGYHPFNEDISNEELPYAHCMLPVTAGSGGAQYAQSVVLNQGDTVFGCFLDGDSAQVPMIMGHFGRTSEVSSQEYTRPFAPYTAFTQETPPNSRVPKTENNEQNKSTQPTPSSASKTRKDQAGSGQKVIVGDTCRSNPISKMANIVENLGIRIEQLTAAGLNIENEIRAAADLIEVHANRFVGNLLNKLFTKFEELGKQGLNLLYKQVYAKVFAATQSSIAAHLAGVAAQIAMTAPTAFLQEAISCVGNKVVEGLAGTIEDILREFVEEGRNYYGCLGAQFVGSFVNAIINDIEEAITRPLSGVAKIIAPGFQVADFLLSAADNLRDFGSFIDCNQSNRGKCPSDKEYVVGGNSQERGDDPFDYVLNAMNLSRGAASLLNDFERQYGKWDIFGDGSLLGDAEPGIIPGGCYGGPENNCTGPYVEIFGGDGSGATAEVILGFFVDNTPGLRPLLGGVERTASIIGAKVTFPGSGYRYPPIVNFRDKCNLGYGAVGRAILGGDNGDQVVAIVMDSTGENYPVNNVNEPGDIGITDVVVSAGGTGYNNTDIVIIPGVSDSGNVFVPLPIGPDTDIFVPPTTEGDFPPITPGIGSTSPIFKVITDDNGTITNVNVINILRFDGTLPDLVVQSDTGVGAILKPVFGDIEETRRDPTLGQVGIVSVIDCI